LIEFDGEYHFDPESYFARRRGHSDVKTKDMLKLKFALESGINLLRISYQEIKHIPEILDKVLRMKRRKEKLFLYNVIGMVDKIVTDHYDYQLEDAAYRIVEV
jgi:very-short-patch-repair endonuclease